MDTRPGVIEVIAKAADGDEGTQLLVNEFLLFDALGEEIDRIRPQLERDTARVMAKQAEGALQVLAKRYARATSDAERAELEETADQLLIFTKADEDDPNTPWWDKRIPAGQPGAGQFADRSGRAQVTRGAMNGMKLFAGYRDAKGDKVGEKTEQHLTAIRDGDRYSRARALGNALRRTGDPTLTAAGNLTRLIGEAGPEAQKVLGRGLSRLAYRYRGTERRPSAALQEQVNSRLSDVETRLNTVDNGVPRTKRLAVTDQRRLHEVGRIGARHLWPQVPDLEMAKLSLEAGRMPPSRGLIFDAKGKVVSEAMGFNGDHYLPFDLKNLKRLQGGQYVRTRTTGGLTDEDIYTGLLAGARQVQVVSNSGVFTLEFDPALRGGRRHSDKARQMVGRYAKLVEKIGEESVMAQDLKPKEIAELRQKALQRSRGNQALYETMLTEEINAERFRRQVEGYSEEELMEMAADIVQADVARGRLKIANDSAFARHQRAEFNTLRDKQRDNAVRKYRLDGEGYQAALKALETEFPYFIRRTDYQPLDKWLQAEKLLGSDDPLPPRPGKDIGYTRRNALIPRKLEGGKRTDTEGPKDGTKPDPKGPKGDDGSGGAGAKVSFEQVLKSPDTRLTRDLAHVLDRSLAGRANFTEGMNQPSATNDDEALTEPADAWAAYALTRHGGPAGVAKWLMDPKTDVQHLEIAERAIADLRLLAENQGSAFQQRYNGWDDAAKMLATVRRVREPFAPPEADMVLAVPVEEAPQPFKEIVEDIGADLDGLVAYAQANPEIAAEAATILGQDEAETVKMITAEAEQLERLARWPRDAAGALDENAPPIGAEPGEFDMARLYHQDPAAFPGRQDLERLQKAWTLARALEVTGALTRRQVPDIGPKAVRKRAPLPRRIVVHSPDSPVAKALARSRALPRR